MEAQWSSAHQLSKGFLMRVQIAESVAIVVIGDGVVGALLPARHAARWVHGPGPWRQAMLPFVEHPGLTRVLGVVQVAAGLGWVATLPSAAR